MNLKERASQFGNSLKIMEGREKGEMKRIVNTAVTIRDYGFMNDENDKEYVCFIVDEDPAHFYFGGQVLTDNMKDLEADGFHEEIVAGGLPVEFGEKKGKTSGKTYTTVKFYPEA